MSILKFAYRPWHLNKYHTVETLTGPSGQISCTILVVPLVEKFPSWLLGESVVVTATIQSTTPTSLGHITLDAFADREPNIGADH